jgi:hypothetical protein
MPDPRNLNHALEQFIEALLQLPRLRGVQILPPTPSLARADGYRNIEKERMAGFKLVQMVQYAL